MAAILNPSRHRPPAPTRARLVLVAAPTREHPRAGRSTAAARTVSVPAAPSPMMFVGFAVAACVAVLLTLLISHGAFAGAVPAAPGTGSAAAAAPAPGSVRSVTVEPGDTVWSIARRVQPDGDVRPLVDRIVALNGSTVVVAGEELTVPQ